MKRKKLNIGIFVSSKLKVIRYSSHQMIVNDIFSITKKYKCNKKLF